MARLPSADLPFVTPQTGRISLEWYASLKLMADVTAGGGGGGVTSFEGRTGIVVSAAGDYTASEITNVPAGNIAAITVQAALNELDSEKIAGSTGATDNALLRADGAGGKTLQATGVTIDDDDNLFLPAATAISWNAGDVTITHAADSLSIAFDGTDKILAAKTQTINTNVFNLGIETDKKSSIVFRGSDAGSHDSQQNNFIAIEHRPVGSGTNGPASADYGLTISIVKNDFTAASPTVGEIDALSLAVRQGGTASDCSAILGNIAHTGTGFSAFFESATSLIPGPTFAATQTVRLQGGVIDNVTPNSFGYFVSADLGTIGEAFRAGTNGGTFTWLFRGQSAGTDVFTVTGDGTAKIYHDDTSTSPALTVEQDGTGDATMQFLLSATRAWIVGVDNSDSDAWKLCPADDGFASTVLAVSTSGNLTLSGAIELGSASDTTLARSAAGVVTIEGNVVKTAGKETGWVPATAMYVASGPSAGALNVGGAIVPYLAFDATTQEFAFFNIAMPKSWDEGTITAQFVWAHPATTTNFGVVWQLGAASFGDDDAIANAYATQNITDTGGTTSDLYISPEISALNPGNTEAEGDVLLLYASRAATDGNDTLAVDAYLIGVKFYYTTNAANDA